MLISESRRIADYGYREHVVDGGLISYGCGFAHWCYQRAAALVVKILRGNAPGDLPVEFPKKVMRPINSTGWRSPR